MGEFKDTARRTQGISRHTVGTFQAEDSDMQVNVDLRVGSGAAEKPAPVSSLFERIGWRGLFLVVWRATPLPLRLVAFPYGVLVYHALLTVADKPDYLYTLHVDKYQSSLAFKLLRPRYHRVKRVLDVLLAANEKSPPD